MDNSILIKHILDIKQASEEGRLVFFVGSGVSNNSGVPTWKTLMDSLRADLPEFAQHENDDLKLAQIYKTTYPSKFLEKVSNTLLSGKVFPNPIHDAILDFHPRHIITTNYDNLIEQAYKNRYEQYAMVCSDEELPSVHNDHLLIKMHGDMDKGNIVLTEQDYYDYSRNFPLIRAYVQSLLASKVVVFIGFSFNDINLKYIIRSLQVILQKRMQPVYMLTDADFGHEQLNYLENLGVNPVCMTEKFISQYEENLSEKISLHKTIANVHGKALYRQLYLILNFSKENNPLKELVNEIQKYNKEIPFLGNYITNFFPSNLKHPYKIDLYNLIIRDNKLEKIASDYKTGYGLFRFCKDYPDIYKLAYRLAFDNKILQINSTDLFSDKLYNSFVRKIENDGVAYLFWMDYNGMTKRIKELGKKPFASSHEDLELPYLYYQLGKFDESFSLYSKISKLYWETRNYVQYMICRINMMAMSGRILQEQKNGKVIEEVKLVLRKSLSNVLRELPLDIKTRKLFNDVISADLFYKNENTIRKISKEINEQRENSKNGGWSWNSYHNSLLEQFSFLFDFQSANYLIIDKIPYVFNSYILIAEGLMDSLMIDSVQEENSHLSYLRNEVLLLLIYNISPTELRKLLKEKCGNRNLPIDDNGKVFLQKIITNLISNKNELISISKTFQQKICDIVHNISLLLCYLPKDIIPDDGLYSLIADCLRIPEEQEYTFIISKLIEMKKPTVEESEAIIRIYLRPFSKQSNNPYFLSQLADIMSSYGKKIAFNDSFDHLTELDTLSLSALYKVFEKSKQDELIEYVKNHISNLEEALLVDINSEFHVLDKSVFDEFMKVFANNEKNPTYWHTVYLLKHFYKTNENPDYREIIDKYTKDIPALKYLLDPIQNADCFDGEMILILEPDEIRNIVSNKELMQEVAKFRSSTYPNIQEIIDSRIMEAVTYSD